MPRGEKRPSRKRLVSVVRFYNFHTCTHPNQKRTARIPDSLICRSLPELAFAQPPSNAFVFICLLPCQQLQTAALRSFPHTPKALASFLREVGDFLKRWTSVDLLAPSNASGTLRGNREIPPDTSHCLMRILSPGGGCLALVPGQPASMRIPDFSDPGALLFLKSIPYSELNSPLFLFSTITTCIPYTNMHVSALTLNNSRILRTGRHLVTAFRCI